MIHDVLRYCSDGTPLPFVLAAAIIDYLSKLVAGKDNKGQGYRDFIKTFLSKVRPEYQTFVYSSGATDLPDQMYSVLRCGLIHSFSLTPDKLVRKQKGRPRSIALCHRSSLGPNDKHLMQYSGPKNLDACRFVVEDFLDDLDEVVRLIFAQARSDAKLNANICGWLNASPPIAGGY